LLLFREGQKKIGACLPAA